MKQPTRYTNSWITNTYIFQILLHALTILAFFGVIISNNAGRNCVEKTQWGSTWKYSDTSANEDNSFQNHIR